MGSDVAIHEERAEVGGPARRPSSKGSRRADWPPLTPPLVVPRLPLHIGVIAGPEPPVTPTSRPKLAGAQADVIVVARGGRGGLACWDSETAARAIAA